MQRLEAAEATEAPCCSVTPGRNVPDSQHGNPTSTMALPLAEITDIHLLAPQLLAVLETVRLVLPLPLSWSPTSVQ